MSMDGEGWIPPERSERARGVGLRVDESFHRASHRWHSTTKELLHVERTTVFGVKVPAGTPVDFVVQVHPDPVQEAEQDVLLRVIFRTSATDATAATEVEVYPEARQAHHTAQIGPDRVPAGGFVSAGELLFHFDNSYSWFNEKDVQLTVVVGDGGAETSERAAAQPAPQLVPPAAVTVTAVAGAEDVVLDLTGMDARLVAKVAELTDCVTGLSETNAELTAANRQSAAQLREMAEVIGLLTSRLEAAQAAGFTS
jgi:hypothetical protein